MTKREVAQCSDINALLKKAGMTLAEVLAKIDALPACPERDKQSCATIRWYLQNVQTA